MYGLPISTERNQQLSKKAIYATFDLKPPQRESFDHDIARMDIAVFASPATVSALGSGEEVTELLCLPLERRGRPMV